MAEHEDENKSEAELKKSYQAILIPEGSDEDPEIEDVSSLTSGEPEKNPD